MTEYIEKQAALDIVNGWRDQLIPTYGKNDEYVKCLETVAEHLESLHAADARPVKHGKWIEKQDKDGKTYGVCSRCGYKQYAGHLKYCPECGGKMDDYISRQAAIDAKFELWQGDCLELMKNIPDGSVDLVLTDPPYGTTACKWDSVIPFEPMWEQLNRIIKSNGAICLFGSEPFSSALRMSNIKNFKYDWIWDKKIPSGMSYARFQPMRQTENISVFCNGKTVYNPQMVKRDKPIKGGGMSKGETTNNQNLIALHKTYDYKNPTNLIVFDKIRKGSLHPTQKPVALLEYLIRTYTNEGETVLDFTMGSGSTGVACVNLKRNFIGMELKEEYFKIAEERINNARLNQQTGGD